SLANAGASRSQIAKGLKRRPLASTGFPRRSMLASSRARCRAFRSSADRPALVLYAFVRLPGGAHYAVWNGRARAGAPRASSLREPASLMLALAPPAPLFEPTQLVGAVGHCCPESVVR